MKFNAKFSVLMSLYYKEKADYLNESLQSISKQTLQPSEIILVHDGELNIYLYEVINKWKNILPIKNIKLNNNVGLGKALNIGLKNCSFEYIVRCDSDDINVEERFEKQLYYMLKNPEIDVLSSNIEEFNKIPGDYKQVRKVPESHSNIKKRIKFRNPINHMAVVYKKSKILKIGSYQHLEFMEDYYLWIRMIADGCQFHNLQECLVNARVGNGMTERRKGLNYIRSEFDIYKKLKQYNLYKPFICDLFFVGRVASRILPVKYLKYVYTLLRG